MKVRIRRELIEYCEHNQEAEIDILINFVSKEKYANDDEQAIDEFLAKVAFYAARVTEWGDAIAELKVG